MKFLFCLKIMEIQRRGGGGGGGGYNFVPEKVFSGIKRDFFEFCSIPRGKYRIAMTRFLLERKFL